MPNWRKTSLVAGGHRVIVQCGGDLRLRADRAHGELRYPVSLRLGLVFLPGVIDGVRPLIRSVLGDVMREAFGPFRFLCHFKRTDRAFSPVSPFLPGGEKPPVPAALPAAGLPTER